MADESDVVGGRYQLLSVVGRGGMSTVWLAMDETLGKQWAVKEIRLSDDPAAREMVAESLVSEANLIKQLDHAAIPRIVDLVDEGGILYVVMDYVEGRTLESLLAEEGPQDEDDVADWAVQLCDVLDYLHQRTPPIVYCDMKPSNVMLRPDGTMRLIDFGIAREEHAAHKAERDGRHLGTRGYASPEQCRGADIDRRTDVYGLGATMYALLTGDRPSAEAERNAALRQLRPELSLGMESLVSKAMEPNPAERFQSAAEMAYALERYKVDDNLHRRGLQRRWHTFMGTVIAAGVCLAVGTGCMVARNVALSSDFDYWMQVARQSVDQDDSRAAYVRAASILPGDIRPYEGLLSLYRQDGVFSADEELQFEQTVTPALSELRADSRTWGSLSYDVGKLYWYYYDASGGKDASGGAAPGSFGAGQSYSRMRAASSWMHSAAEVPDFENRGLAAAYAEIADFEMDVVPNITEGTDAGLYAPHFQKLSDLMWSVGSSDNAVVRLDASNLVLDSLRAYARKFRADGIAEGQLQGLADDAGRLAASVDVSSDAEDAEKARAQRNYPLATQAISDSFVDVGRDEG